MNYFGNVIMGNRQHNALWVVETSFKWSNWVSYSIHSFNFHSHSDDSQMRSCCSIFHVVATSQHRSLFMNTVSTVATTLILREKYPDSWIERLLSIEVSHNGGTSFSPNQYTRRVFTIQTWNGVAEKYTLKGSIRIKQREKKDAIC